MIEDHLPKERLDISFTIVDENKRIIKITPHGEKYQSMCEAVL